MKHLFYFIAIAPLFYEFICIKNIKKVSNFCQDLKKTEYENRTETQKTFSFLMFFYLAWVLIGLASSQWILFLILILLSIVPKHNIIIRWIDSFFAFCVLLAIVLNAYHFKIDLLNVIIEQWTK